MSKLFSGIKRTKQRIYMWSYSFLRVDFLICGHLDHEMRL